MSAILNVHARQILDSRGNPTVEVEVITEMVPWAAQWFPQVLVPVCTKPWN